MPPTTRPQSDGKRGHKLKTLVLVCGLLVGALAITQPAAAESDTRWDYVDSSISGSYVALAGYFNHDKITDILWYCPGACADSLWLGTSTKGQFTKKTLNISKTYRPILGDFGLDSYTDIFWYCPGTCADALWLADGTSNVFKSQPETVDGYYYVPSVQAASGVEYFDSYGNPYYGGMTMRDLGFGKDDILWYAGSLGPEDYWHFSDTGDGTHTRVSTRINSDYAPIRGNFSGGNNYDDILLYGPGSVDPSGYGKDYLWTADGTGHYTQKSLTINGWYSPVMIARNALNPPAGEPPAVDAIMWYDQWTCGTSATPIWHFIEGGGYSNRAVTIPGASKCLTSVTSVLDNYVVPFQGTASAIINRTMSTDYQVFDADSGASIKRLTPTASRDINSASVPVTGDFNGDGLADIFWYIPGPTVDPIWYGKQGLPKSLGTRFDPATNPDGVPAVAYP